MLDLDAAIRRYFDEAAIPVDFEQTVSGRVPLAGPTRPRLRPAVAFALGLLVVAVVLLPLVLLRSDPEPAVVATVPPPTSTPTAPTVTPVTTTTIDAPATSLPPAANPRLVGWFSFDGSTENLADPSGASDGASIRKWTGGAPGEVVYTSDRFGNPESAFLGLLREYLEIPMVDGLRAESGTVSAWVMPVGEMTKQFYWFDIVSFGAQGYTLGLDGYHRPTVNRVPERNHEVLSEPPTYCIWTSEEGLPVDRWYHLAMVFDGPQVAIFVDGVPVDLRSYEAVGDWTTNLIAGSVQAVGTCDLAGPPGGTAIYVGNNTWGSLLEAYVDDVLIYDGVLSPEAIAALSDDRP